MDTPDRPPTLYQLDLATLGYAIGRLLRHTWLRTQRSLANATRQFLEDTGMSLHSLNSKELETLFYHVGRGYAKPFLPQRSRPASASAGGESTRSSEGAEDEQGEPHR